MNKARIYHVALYAPTCALLDDDTNTAKHGIRMLLNLLIALEVRERSQQTT